MTDHNGLTVDGRERALTFGATAGFSFAACMFCAAAVLAAAAVRAVRPTKDQTT